MSKVIISNTDKEYLTNNFWDIEEVISALKQLFPNANEIRYCSESDDTHIIVEVDEIAYEVSCCGEVTEVK